MSDDLTETRMAAYRAARVWATQHSHPQPDDRMIKAALTAAKLGRLTRERSEARDDVDALRDKLRISVAGYEMWVRAAEAAEAERDRLADTIRQYEPVIEAAKAWYTARWNTRAGDSARALSDAIEALEEGPLKLHPIDPLRPEDINHLIDPSAEAELNRLRAALRLCEHVLHRVEPCDAMLHAAQQAAGAYTTDWTLADVADDLAPGTVLDIDDPEIDWNEVRWND